VILPALYHWAPAERHAAITTEGLRPHSVNTVASTNLPYVCLGVEPGVAWNLSGGMEWVSEVPEWDLWQVSIGEGDHVCVRPDFGPRIHEVKVYGPIPPDRVWWVGRRGSPPLTEPNDGELLPEPH
jgi:hypothetical protein